MLVLPITVLFQSATSLATQYLESPVALLDGYLQLDMLWREVG